MNVGQDGCRLEWWNRLDRKLHLFTRWRQREPGLSWALPQIFLNGSIEGCGRHFERLLDGFRCADVMPGQSEIVQQLLLKVVVPQIVDYQPGLCIEK